MPLVVRPTPQTEPTPAELDDARRRFILALRVMIQRKERQARSDAALAEWTATLEREIATYRRVVRAHRIRRLAFWAAALSALTGLAFAGHGAWQIFIVFMFWKGLRDVRQNARTQTATALARARDPRAVNVLAKAARDGDAETRSIAAQGLVSILPSLQASDREYISNDGAKALAELLAAPPRSGGNLLRAVLRGLEQIGDAGALPAVEELLQRLDPVRRGNRPSWSLGIYGEDREALVQAAIQCRDTLLVHANRERQRTTLLRPASAPDNAAEVLLRPAGGVPTGDPALLLRPVMPEVEEGREEQGTTG